jgi:lipopolysaccharide export system protein LptA
LSVIARGAIALIVAALAGAPALGATKPSSPSPLLPGANSKEPISIDADKLNYYDKEQKAVYTGNVVAIQGDTKLTCTVMTIFLAKTEAPGSSPSGNALSPAAAPAPDNSATGGSQVRHMDATGPVTLVSKTQVATGDRASYDKVQNKVWLFSNVTLSDGGNVTKGDKLTYDLTTGEAIVEVGKSTSRVHGQFIQGSAGADEADKSTAPKKEGQTGAIDKPKPAKKQTTPANPASPKS